MTFTDQTALPSLDLTEQRQTPKGPHVLSSVSYPAQVLVPRPAVCMEGSLSSLRDISLSTGSADVQRGETFCVLCVGP